MSGMTDISDVDPTKEYSVAETAVFLGVVPRTVRRYLEDGFLEWRRRGPYPQSGYLIPGRSIREYLANMGLESDEIE